MVNPDFIKEEEFLGKARIYHRYRISGLRPGGDSTVRAVQRALPLVAPEQEKELVDL